MLRRLVDKALPSQQPIEQTWSEWRQWRPWIDTAPAPMGQVYRLFLEWFQPDDDTTLEATLIVMREKYSQRYPLKKARHYLNALYSKAQSTGPKIKLNKYLHSRLPYLIGQVAQLIVQCITFVL